MFNIKFLRRPEDVQEKPEIQFLLEMTAAMAKTFTWGLFPI